MKSQQPSNVQNTRKGWGNSVTPLQSESKAERPAVHGRKNWRKLRWWSGASYFEAVTRGGFLRVPVRVITGDINERGSHRS